MSNYQYFTQHQIYYNIVVNINNNQDNCYQDNKISTKLSTIYIVILTKAHSSLNLT